MVKNFALVIGINHYEHIPKKKQLNFAVRDAEAMRDVLRDRAGFPEENIWLCTATSVEDKVVISQPVEGINTTPALINLKRILRNKIPQGVDNFLFFFAGHGINDNHQDCLIPSDGDISISDGLITTNFIIDCLRDLHGIKNIVLVLDMCREFSPYFPGSRDTGSVGAETERLAKQKGIITIFACQRDKKSYEIADEEIRHGAFTYCLLQGLKQHTILRNLDEYLKQEVKSLTKSKINPPQTQIPLVICEPADRYDQPLFTQHVTKADISFLQQQAEKMERKARTIPQLKEAKELWKKLIRLSNDQEIRIEALDSIDNIDHRIEEKEQINSNQPPPKVEESQPRAVVGQVVEIVKPVVVEPLKLPTYGFSVISIDAQGHKIAEEMGEAEYFAEELGAEVKLEMVSIPGGDFWMGATEQEIEEAIKNAKSCRHDEKDARTWANYGKERHRVKVPAFSMGKFQVTQEQWKQVAEMPKVKTDLKLNPEDFVRFKDAKLPVDSVNWHQAVEFCSRLSKHTKNSYRLPSEAEWEYACRAKTDTAFHFGATITPEYVNYDGNYPYAQAPKVNCRQTTTTGGTFLPNGFGLYDMHGNLWEWCEDDWQDSYQGAPENGSAWLIKKDSQQENKPKVLRGGSWYNYDGDCRSAFRDRYDADYCNYLYGFRVVCFPVLLRTR